MAVQEKYAPQMNFEEAQKTHLELICGIFVLLETLMPDHVTAM